MALSAAGILHTGDMGSYSNTTGLSYVCRLRHLLKPKGFLVYPPEVEDSLTNALRGRASSVAIVGVPHQLYSEALYAFVEKIPGTCLTVEDVLSAASSLTSYKRPLYATILEHGDMPLNRVAKVDYRILKEKAITTVTQLKAEGKWD